MIVGVTFVYFRNDADLTFIISVVFLSYALASLQLVIPCPLTGQRIVELHSSF
jgi:hypothetical protein